MNMLYAKMILQRAILFSTSKRQLQAILTDQDSSRADLRTPGMVRRVGWNMVLWVALAVLATVPRSPVSSYFFLMRASLQPVAAVKACSRD